jgi:hypothetical protein
MPMLDDGGGSMSDEDDNEWIAELARADRQINDLVRALVWIRDHPDATAVIAESAHAAIERRFWPSDD